MEILAKLGIDWHILIAQLVNFGLVLLVLHRFAYKPLLGVLEKREKTIEKSLAAAKEIEKRLKDTEEQSRFIIEKARREAVAVIEEAALIAEQKRNAALEKAKDDVGAVIADAKVKIATEKQTMLREAKEQLGELVVKAARAVVDIGVEKDIPADLVAKVVARAGEALK